MAHHAPWLRNLVLWLLVSLAACRPPEPDATQSEARGESLSVLAEAVHTVEQHYVDDGLTDQELLVRLAVEGMVGELDGTSTVLTGPDAKRSPEDLWIPIPAWGCILGPDRGKIRVFSVFPGGAFDQAHIRSGMEIVLIGDTPVAASMLYSPKGPVQMSTTGAAQLVVGQDDLFTRRRIQPDPVGMSSVEVEEPDDNGVAVIRLRWLDADTAWRLKARLQSPELQPSTALVLDLRGCASLRENLARDVASLFMPSQTELWTVQTRDHQESTVRSRSGPAVNPLPMLVLIDHSTAGTPELIGEALGRMDRVTLAGTPSAGKAVRLERVALENGMWLFLSSGYYLDPAGQRIAKKGVTPDLAPSDIDQKTSDPVLREALRILGSKP